MVEEHSEPPEEFKEFFDSMVGVIYNTRPEPKLEHGHAWVPKSPYRSTEYCKDCDLRRYGEDMSSPDYYFAHTETTPGRLDTIPDCPAFHPEEALRGDNQETIEANWGPVDEHRQMYERKIEDVLADLGNQ